MAENAQVTLRVTRAQIINGSQNTLGGTQGAAFRTLLSHQSKQLLIL